MLVAYEALVVEDVAASASTGASAGHRRRWLRWCPGVGSIDGEAAADANSHNDAPYVGTRAVATSPIARVTVWSPALSSRSSWLADGAHVTMTHLKQLAQEWAQAFTKRSAEAARKRSAASTVAAAISEQAALLENERAVIVAAMTALEPLLQTARMGLNVIRQVDLAELRSYAKPPEAIRTLLEAILIVLGELPAPTAVAAPRPPSGARPSQAAQAQPPLRRAAGSSSSSHAAGGGASTTGGHTNDREYWDTIRRFLASDSFVPRVKAFEPTDTLKRAAAYLAQLFAADGGSFGDTKRMAAVSRAAVPMLEWLRVILQYGAVIEQMKPKKAAIEKLAAAIAEKEAELASRRAEFETFQAQLVADVVDQGREVFEEGVVVVARESLSSDPHHTITSAHSVASTPNDRVHATTASRSAVAPSTNSGAASTRAEEATQGEKAVRVRSPPAPAAVLARSDTIADDTLFYDDHPTEKGGDGGAVVAAATAPLAPLLLTDDRTEAMVEEESAAAAHPSAPTTMSDLMWWAPLLAVGIVPCRWIQSADVRISLLRSALLCRLEEPYSYSSSSAPPLSQPQRGGKATQSSPAEGYDRLRSESDSSMGSIRTPRSVLLCADQARAMLAPPGRPAPLPSLYVDGDRRTATFSGSTTTTTVPPATTSACPSNADMAALQDELMTVMAQRDQLAAQCDMLRIEVELVRGGGGGGGKQ